MPFKDGREEIIMNYEIIDFHTHPFTDNKNNICGYKSNITMDSKFTENYLKNLGISKICGSFIPECPKGMPNSFDDIKERNNTALKLKDMYNGFYIPGFHIHPSFVKESLEEIERMSKLGVRLIGELVPYFDGWNDYSDKNLDEIFEYAAECNMIISFHSQGEDEMDKMVKKHKNVTFVAAHPGEYDSFMRHLERMKMSENYYLDLSGYGLFRCGMLRKGIDEMGSYRFIFGSDYPTCNPSMYVGGVLYDSLISDSEKEIIFCENAKRLLNIE